MKIYDLYEKVITGIFCVMGIALVTIQLLPNQSEIFKTQISDTGIFQSMNTYFASFKETDKSKTSKSFDQGQVIFASSSSNNSGIAFLINKDSIPSQKRGSRSVIHSVNNNQEVEVTLIDGEVTKLKINKKRIAPEDFEKYAALVESVQAESGPNQTKPIYEPKKRNSERSDKEFQQRLIQDLLADNLIKSENKFSFSITKKQLIVDGKIASQDLLEKYLQLMKDEKGEHITNGTSYEIEKY